MTTRLDFAHSPALYPIALDIERATVRTIALSEADYRAASFLDQRLLTSNVAEAAWTLADIETASATLGDRRHFIFHIGHVGSTLLSRLVGEHRALFAVREPAILRDFAHRFSFDSGAASKGAELEDQTDVMLRLWSRTWRPDQMAVIKATSFVSAIAGALLNRSPGSRALFIFATPPAYLRGVLGGPASRVELGAMAAGRLSRLQRRLGPQGWRLDAMSEGEAIAMSWLCEMTALYDAALSHPNAVLWVDFDRFLAAPHAGLAKALAHLRAPAEDDWLQAVLAGPIARQYAKAPEHAYDAALRREVLAQADREHGAEVRRGMDWLGRTAASTPHVREVLELAARVARGGSPTVTTAGRL